MYYDDDDMLMLSVHDSQTSKIMAAIGIRKEVMGNLSGNADCSHDYERGL